MSCKRFEISLIDFHFGTLNPELRSDLELHLEGCSKCLKDYFNLKADIENRITQAEEPTPKTRKAILLQARAYLRAIPRESSRFYTPVPKVYWLTASSLAVAALAFITIFSSKSLIHRLTHADVTSLPVAQVVHEESHRSHEETRIDTARQVPENLNFL